MCTHRQTDTGVCLLVILYVLGAEGGKVKQGKHTEEKTEQRDDGEFQFKPPEFIRRFGCVCLQSSTVV